jgi:Glycosyl hydrolase family 26
MKIIARHGAVPLVFWSPWDRPYSEGRGPDKYSLRRILAGEHDAYIDRWADAAKEHAAPIMVSFCNEMNGAWFPWSGLHYGGGKEIPGTDPERYEGPELFKKAWRHVVDRVRARGASNVLWVFHTMDYSMPNDSWNMAAEYYPGPEYVDWMGFSLYGNQFTSDSTWAPFFPLFDWPYTELTLLDPKKPIMLCEWGVGEFPKLGDKGGWIRDGFELMADEKKYPRIKAAVYWHERWQNSANEADESSKENAGKYSDLRVNSSPGALEAYRKGVASPFFLSEPRWVPKPR